MTTANIVGVPNVNLLQDEIKSLIELWNRIKPASGWLSTVKGAWLVAAKFLLEATDALVIAIEEKVIPGPDKKATVMAAISQIYDAIIPVLLPIVLKPFNAKIKSFLIDVVISLMIDFVVSKYNNGSWTPPQPTPAS
jgi:hypothetical protein